MGYSIRLATPGDVAALDAVIAESSRALGRDDYTPEQIEGALGTAFGVDTQLIADATYFVVEAEGEIVGCGGWSRRTTLFGSDARADREPALLDPAHDAARIRAFFVRPDWARRGIGRTLLLRCEAAARAEGFHRMQLMATIPGVRLYAACGYSADPPVQHHLPSGVAITFIPMHKTLV